MRLVVMFCGVALAACAASAQPAPRTPDWLAGYWLACEGGETAENWIGAGRGVMLGTNLSGGGFEFLRIAENTRGGFSYFSMPGGRSPPTEFTMVELTGRSAVFENLAHDFPQRIIYARDQDTLTARIEDAAGTQSAEWRFHRAAPDARCTG